MNWYKKDVTFFVDMDETLLHSEYLSDVIHKFNPVKEPNLDAPASEYLDSVKVEEMDKEQQKKMAEENGYKVTLDLSEDCLVTKLRPFAKEFLSALSSKGKVYLLTSAMQDYADSALNIYGLDGFFTGKYYRQNIKGLPIKPDENFFLIDDLEFSDLENKFRFLGAPIPTYMGNETEEEYNKRVELVNRQYGPKHIRVSPFMGQDGDMELSSILGKINGLV